MAWDDDDLGWLSLTQQPEEMVDINDPSYYPPSADYSNEGRSYSTDRGEYQLSTQGPGGSPINASYLANSGLGGFLKKLLKGEGSTADYATSLAGILALSELLNKDRSPKTWSGTLTKPAAGRFTAPQVSQAYKDALASRAYGARAVGMNPFTAGTGMFNPAAGGIAASLPFGPTESSGGAAPAPAPSQTPTPAQVEQAVIENQALRDDIQSAGAAEGGLLELARGGRTPVRRQSRRLPPRYLRGETDGMEDKIPSNIDGVQPAKLSHGEFVIPADVVSHLGNGNSDAGAKVLYKMMDRVRHARTGNKKQGKRINPEKFTPGGIAGYAGGGAVAFQTGGSTAVNAGGTGGTLSGGLSPWVGDYVAGPEGYLTKAWALADQPYQAYEGPLTAGTSPLQQQAFTGLSNLGTPGQFGMATNLAAQAGQKAGELSTYKPTAFSAPGVSTSNVSSTYQAPAAYQAGTFDAGFKAPTPFQAGTFSTGYTPGQFSTGLGAIGSVQDYMSPYQQNVIDIQAREARRQADISRAAEQARLAQAGAYGGSRQAIMEAERQRNLGTQIGDIQEKGLQSAYDRALAQRMQEAQLGLQAQQFGEQARQFGTTTGLQAQQFGEQSRQFGAQQALSAAQLASQFGLDAQKAQELSRQFGYGQQMTANQLQAQFGLDAQKANQLAQLQASTANQRAAMEAQQMAEQSKQFGANLGLQGLSQQLAAAGQLGSLGTQQFGTQLQGLNALLGAGNIQQAAEQAAVDAQLKQFQEAQLFPYKQLQFQQSMLQGLPVSTSTTTPNSSMFADLTGGIGGLLKLNDLLKGAGG
jgi:hypothetical protein